MEGKTGGLHIIYRPSELSDEHFIGACGTPTDNKDSFFPDIPSFASHGMKEFKGLKVKRQASTQLYLELYVVTDVQSYSLRNGNLQSLLQDVVEAVNTMDSFYQTLNTVVRVALVEIETWTATNQIPITADSSATLTQWKAYYQRNIKTKDANPDAGILFVGVQFNGNVLGIAPRGAMCGNTNAGVSRLRVGNALSTATTASHELGHMYGLLHDDDIDPCSCADPQCIMTAIISTIPTKWSQCSQTEFARFVRENNYAGRCLDDEPTFINSQNRIPYHCGNGIKEPGEACDCGPADSCTDLCCNGTTCELASTAQCASGEACCENCLYKAAGVECRSQVGECDVPDFCTGSAGECPDNRFVRNGYNCTNGAESGYCIEGQCLTHSSQCKALFGTESAPEAAYGYNRFGNCYGQCSRVGTTENFNACPTGDLLCGNIKCRPSSGPVGNVPSGSSWVTATFSGTSFS
jgi:hypothetical protein